MFGLIAAGVVVLLVGYCTWVLFFNLDQETGTDLSDFIRDTPGLPQYLYSLASKKVTSKKLIHPLPHGFFELEIVKCVCNCKCVIPCKVSQLQMLFFYLCR